MHEVKSFHIIDGDQETIVLGLRLHVGPSREDEPLRRAGYKPGYSRAILFGIKGTPRETALDYIDRHWDRLKSDETIDLTDVES